MAQVKIPAPNDNASKEDLIDIMYRYKKELEYLLMNLDGDNVPIVNSIIEDVDGNKTSITQNAEEISLLATDVEGNTSNITQNADQIALVASDVDDNAAAIVVNSDNISLKVGNDEVISKINASPESIQISSSRVDITAGDLNITAGDVDFTVGTYTIDADHINLNGVTTMTGLTRVSDDLYLGNDDNYNTLTFDMLSGNATIQGVSGNLAFSAGQFSFDDTILVGGDIRCNGIDVKGYHVNDVDNIYLKGIYGNGVTAIDVYEDIDMNSNEINGIDRLQVNGQYVVYGVGATESVTFYDYDGRMIGGINFSTGNTWT